MNKKYLISIIMPAYNVESYIADTISSVKAQTYENWELIIVNDGSTDNTRVVCESFAKNDSRIKIITQKNQHQGPARNNGFLSSSGDFIYFADSDDKIHPQCFELLLKIYEKNRYDFISFRLESFCDGEKPCVHQIADSSVIRYVPVHKAVWEFSQTPPTFFFARKLLEKSGVDFPSYFHEDDAEMYRIFSYAEKIVQIDDVLYFYRRRKDSTMGLTCNSHSADILHVVQRFLEIGDKRKEFHDVFYGKAEALIKLRLGDWKKINEPWAIEAIKKGEKFLSDLREVNKDNPYVFIPDGDKHLYESSLSWRVTSPLRKLKRMLGK